MRLIVLLLSLLLFYGCKGHKSENKDKINLIQVDELAYSSYNRDSVNLDAKNKVLKGDTLEYLNLRVFMLQRPDFDELLPSALILSHKYNYAQAYYDVYFIFSYKCGLKDIRLSCCDDETRQMAFESLVQAAKLGHLQAKEYCQRLSLSTK